MKTQSILAITAVTAFSIFCAMPTEQVLAQQKQRVTYKVAPENSKYTQ